MNFDPNYLERAVSAVGQATAVTAAAASSSLLMPQLLLLSMLLLEVVVDGGVDGASVVDPDYAAARGGARKSPILGHEL